MLHYRLKLGSSRDLHGDERAKEAGVRRLRGRRRQASVVGPGQCAQQGGKVI